MVNFNSSPVFVEMRGVIDFSRSSYRLIGYFVPSSLGRLSQFIHLQLLSAVTVCTLHLFTCVQHFLSIDNPLAVILTFSFTYRRSQQCIWVLVGRISPFTRPHPLRHPRILAIVTKTTYTKSVIVVEDTLSNLQVLIVIIMSNLRGGTEDSPNWTPCGFPSTSQPQWAIAQRDASR